MRAVCCVMVLLACDGGREAAAPRTEPEPPVRQEPAAAKRGEPPEPAAEETPSPADAFDPRLAIAEPDAHVGEERLCDVAFAERSVDVTGRERLRYPIPVVRRIAVRCAAADGRGWADLVFREERAADAPRVEAGRRVRVRVVAPDGGFAGYPVLEHLELVGPAAPIGDEPEPAAPEPAFDFGRAGDPGVVRSERRCAVDFAGRPERIDARQRRLHPYPEGATVRVPTKCLHERGDAWVDLVFGADDAPRALGIARGTTVTVRVLDAEHGYAGRPIVQWVAP